MAVVVLDKATIDKLFVAAKVEVRDERGILFGYFEPVVSPETVDQYECPVSEEELDRIEREGGGRPLADILRDLRSRP